MPPSKMEDLMQCLYFKILPLLGVNCYIVTKGFQGLGLPNVVVLCFVANVSFMECHFGSDNTAGTTMIHDYEAMLMEVGLYGNILHLDYKK